MISVLFVPLLLLSIKIFVEKKASRKVFAHNCTCFKSGSLVNYAANYFLTFAPNVRKHDDINRLLAVIHKGSGMVLVNVQLQKAKCEL